MLQITCRHNLWPVPSSFPGQIQGGWIFYLTIQPHSILTWGQVDTVKCGKQLLQLPGKLRTILCRRCKDNWNSTDFKTSVFGCCAGMEALVVVYLLTHGLWISTCTFNACVTSTLQSETTTTYCISIMQGNINCGYIDKPKPYSQYMTRNKHMKPSTFRGTLSEQQ